MEGWGATGRMASLFWLRSEKRIEAWTKLGMILALQVAKAKAATSLSESTRIVMASAARVISGAAHPGELYAAVTGKAMLLLLFAPLDYIYEHLLRRLKMVWSRFMTKTLLRGYVNISVQKVSLEPSGNGDEKSLLADSRDNLDQNVAEDVDKFIDLSLDLFLEVVQATIHLYFFSKMLWQVSPKLSKSALFLSGLGTASTLFVGRNLPRLYENERTAANNFRYALTRVRENAESISFYNGERNEVQNIRDLHVLKHMTMWSRKQCRDIVSMSSGTFRKLAGMLPLFLLLQEDSTEKCSHNHDHGHSHNHSHAHSHSHGGPISHGHSHTGSIHLQKDDEPSDKLSFTLQASEAFDEILFHLMIIAENLNDFARLSTVSSQLEEVYLKVRALEGDKSPRLGSRSESEGSGVKTTGELDSQIKLTIHKMNEEDLADGTPWLLTRDLSITCRGETLLENLSLKLFPGSRLLVTGESGVGKTTLLRAIQGLYKNGSGVIFRPPRTDIAFIPQQPYMTLGSLREQLLYPLPKKEIDESRDDELRDALSLVGLDSVLSRSANGLSTIAKWSEVMSVGEQQRLAFARIILQKPSRPFVFLDEATSACDITSETKMYKLLSASCSSWVSIGHRTSIERFHDQRLILRRGGSWELEPLP